MRQHSVPRLAWSIADELLRGITTVVLMPEHGDASEVEYALELAVEQTDRYFDVRRLVLSAGEGAAVGGGSVFSPLRFLLQAFDVTWKDGTGPLTWDNLLAAAELPEAIVAAGFTGLSFEQKRQWLQCIAEGSAAAARRREQHPAFCVVAQASDPALQGLRTSSNLKTHYWCNLHTLTALAAEHQLSFLGKRLGEVHWKAALVTSLAGSDRSLVEPLGEAVVRSKEAVFTCLQKAAIERGFTPKTLQGEGVHLLLSGSSFQPLDRLNHGHPIVHLWARGFLNYSAEYGWEVPSWVLAALGEVNLLEHRIWRAQLPIVLPIINQFRLMVIRHLMQFYGVEWLLAAAQEHRRLVPAGANDPKPLLCPFDAELSDLRYILEGEASRSHQASQYLSVLRLAHFLRNQLAHYTAIEPAEYFKLLEGVQALGLAD